jgi:predicted XRE-type DNA-binding protein
MSESYKSVWDALSDTPEEAANMKLRSILMSAIQVYCSEVEGNQTAKAKSLGITQPRLNDLLKGKIDKFSLDTLVNIADKSGLEVTMGIKAA